MNIAINIEMNKEKTELNKYDNPKDFHNTRIVVN